MCLGDASLNLWACKPAQFVKNAVTTASTRLNLTTLRIVVTLRLRHGLRVLLADWKELVLREGRPLVDYQSTGFNVFFARLRGV